MTEDNVTLELEIEALFEAGVRNAGKMSNEGRAEGFHVSSLSYDCLRLIQYGVMANQKTTSNLEQLEEVKEEDFEGILRMWIGTQLHLTPLTRMHEWPLFKVYNVNGQEVHLNGHIDEVYERQDGSACVIDKKFVGTVPSLKLGANEHHVRQVSYYAGLLKEQTGLNVTHGALLYVAPAVKRFLGQERLRVFTFPIDTAAALAELDGKVRAVATAMQEKRIIERNVGWMCKYCKARADCELLSGPIDGQKKLEVT